MSSRRIRVAIVDDSASMRAVLSKIIEMSPDFQVIGTAADAYAARELIRNGNPDVVTLDVEMPGMDGLTFLEKLMRLKPTPVIMISTLTEQGSQVTLEALRLGAVDYVAKPVTDSATGIVAYADEIHEKLRAAATARIARPLSAPAKIERYGGSKNLLLIGASTGGTEALAAVMRGIPADVPPIMIVQHMPAGFTTSFALRLDGMCRATVQEAKNGMPLAKGNVYLAPGAFHLRLGARADWCCELTDSEPVNRHKPSVDVLFDSIAQRGLAKRCGVAILTGMGADGAAGMKRLHDMGAHTIAQDEASCVVFGMPRAAIQLGGVSDILPLGAIADRLCKV